MAVFILGVTGCPLCGRVIEAADDVVNFPPLFLNRHHDVFEITDSVVHRSCLDQRPYAGLALGKLAAADEHRARARVCQICGQDITQPDDYFGTGPLADDPREEIARLDWFEAHIRCLITWEGRPELVRELAQFSNSTEWEGDVLDRLVRRPEEFGTRPVGP
jgi:hypothetical protein